MPQVLPISLLRAALGAVLAAAIVLANLAPSAPAAPAPVTVRIEGLNSTILPETAVTTDAHEVPIVPLDSASCTGDAGTRPTSFPNAMGALVDASYLAGFTHGIKYDADYDAMYLCRVASELGDDSGYWSVKVNHIYLTVGGDQYQLAPGDRVVWFRTLLYPAPTLDVVTPSKAASGSQIAVTVSVYDDVAHATPASGARIKLGPEEVTTGSNGEAAFTAPQPGTYQLAAEQDGAIRSPTYTVCVFDPALGGCDTTPVTAAAAPSAKIAKPVDGRIYGKIRKISGSVEGDLADARTVRLRVKRIRQRRCTRWHDGSARFAKAKQRLRSTSCAKPGSFDVPVGDGGKWSYRFRKALAPGVYSVNARAVDSAGNVEAAARDRVNRVSFAVRHEQRAKKG